MASARLKVTFRGTVQGVGFRYTACEVAEGFEVAGYVKNMRDGSVEMVAEGEKEELLSFRGAILDRMGGYVRGQEEEWGLAKGEFAEFRVAF
ncbi:MAG: acylphosphatase [Planctomycetota bacterium]